MSSRSSSMEQALSAFWFRRDLRLEDNAGLYEALRGENPVLCFFIFDREILDDLENERDGRVGFIHDEISRLDEELKSYGSSLIVGHGNVVSLWEKWLEQYPIGNIYTNRDYEPYAKERDERVARLIKEKKGGSFKAYKDQVIFHKDEVLKDDGDPYVVFTPYMRTWYERLENRKTSGNTRDGYGSYFLKSYPSASLLERLYRSVESDIPSLAAIGFKRSGVEIPSRTVPERLIREYDQKRDYPAEEGTSRLGIHFRFGTISIRKKMRQALEWNKTFAEELIWREFYSMILDHFPYVVDRPFRGKYEAIPWRNDEDEFRLWCAGKTGYPIVDAGMRQLEETGYMHNRVRMITASFLTKHLLIDWRWGEAHFAKKLLDYELASNNGGWQWAAGSGTDAAPYFRIFNPRTQQKKYDQEERYIRRWIPEYGRGKYPEPMVDHKEARERCLRVYKQALSRTG